MSINMQSKSGKNFFGDFLGSVSSGLGSLAGGAIGTLVGQPALGAMIGGGLGSALEKPLRGLPFKKGGKVSKAKKAPKGKKPAHMVAGSASAKAHMKRLRAMKK